MNRIIVIINLLASMPFLTIAQQTFSINDYANFAKYEAANRELLQSEIQPKIVFMGNSITEAWVDVHPQFFENEGFVGRGIGGQVSHQMLLRFQADVIDLRPGVVVILAGTNDLAQNSGPVTLKQIMDNIEVMTTLAAASNITVALCSVLPAKGFPWFPAVKPTEMIIELNERIKAYSDRNDLIYVDYYSAMVDDKGGLKVPEYTSADDLVHPNEAGYAVMESVVLKSLEKVLSRP